MTFVVDRGLGIPLWATALCAVALTSPAHLPPMVSALFGMTVIASMMTAMFGRSASVARQSAPCDPDGRAEGAGAERKREQGIDLRSPGRSGAWRRHLRVAGGARRAASLNTSKQAANAGPGVKQ
jgi:hypothetical protein